MIGSLRIDVDDLTNVPKQHLHLCVGLDIMGWNIEPPSKTPAHSCQVQIS